LLGCGGGGGVWHRPSGTQGWKGGWINVGAAHGREQKGAVQAAFLVPERKDFRLCFVNSELPLWHQELT